MAQLPLFPHEEHWHIELEFQRVESKALLKKHPEVREAIKRVHVMLIDIASLVECTPKKIAESKEWATLFHRVEADRVSLCRMLEGKTLFSNLYGVYSITVSELKVVLQQSAAKKVLSAAETTIAIAITAITTAVTATTAAASAPEEGDFQE
jgi:hypothetical protein